MGHKEYVRAHRGNGAPEGEDRGRVLKCDERFSETTRDSKASNARDEQDC